MEPEIKDLLEKDLALSEENNKILKKMFFSSRLSLVLSVVKWAVIIGSVLGITYLLGPQLEAMISTYQDLLR